MTSDRPGPYRTSEVPSLVDNDESELEMTQTTDFRATKPPSAGNRDRAFLIILSGSNAGEMHLLKHPEVILGRSREAAIRLEDNGVSRRHARIFVESGLVQVEDLGSANGTLVNGIALASKHVLQDGDKISLGSTVILKFTYSDEFEASFQRKLLDRALRDGLTNAFNMRYLMDRLTTELAFAKRHSTPLSLVMLDVDHFKRTNDTFGHPAGDAVLVKLATTIHATIRKEDVFARYGGEEFAVLLRGTNLERAAVLAERIRTLVASAVVEHEGRRIPISVSLGVAAFPQCASDAPEKLIGAADAALYEAKQNGRNRVVVRGKPRT